MRLSVCKRFTEAFAYDATNKWMSLGLDPWGPEIPGFLEGPRVLWVLVSRVRSPSSRNAEWVLVRSGKPGSPGPVLAEDADPGRGWDARGF